MSAVDAEITIQEARDLFDAAIRYGSQSVLDNIRDEQAYFGGGIYCVVGFSMHAKATNIALTHAYGSINAYFTRYKTLEDSACE